MFLDSFTWSVLVCATMKCIHLSTVGTLMTLKKLKTIILVMREVLQIGFISFEAVLAGPCGLVVGAFFLNQGTVGSLMASKKFTDPF